MPQTKKKTASKTSKSGAARVKKVPAARSGNGSRPKPAVKKTAASKKSVAAGKTSSKKASIKPKSTEAIKKSTAGRAKKQNQAAKSPVAKKAGKNDSAGKKPANKNAPGLRPNVDRSGEGKSTAKINKTISKPVELKKKSAAVLPDAAARAQSKVVVSPPEPKRKKSQEDGLTGSISQGLTKLGQKKRGWRDIEALTERARLKSLLSDIWHEDIDLDSDIFGETDQFSTYYTDKEEEIEVDDDEDDEWEEFEEEES